MRLLLCKQALPALMGYVLQHPGWRGKTFIFTWLK